MRRSFSFRVRSRCIDSDQVVDVLCIVLGRSSVDVSIVDDEVQDALKDGSPIPDKIAILVPANAIDPLIDQLAARPDLMEVLAERGRVNDRVYLKEISLYCFVDGDFVVRHRGVSSSASFSLDWNKILEAGLSNLADSRSVLQISPPGHSFRNPSGRMSPFFIFATEMFKDEVDAYFVALCICFRRWVVVKSVSSVHIDTMGIYPVARAIEDIVAPVDGGWIISSFHSHVGLGRIRDVYVSAGLVLVSASTSGSMVNRLVQDGVSSALIVTIFDVAKRDPHFVLHSFDVDSLTLCGGGGEGVIDIAGEYFVATGKKPRAVVIGVRHKPAALSSVIDSLVPKNGIRLNSPRPGNVQCTDAAHIDESLLCKADGVRDWIKKEVQWRVPSGVSHVVYGGDGARGMAEEALKAIQADGYDGAALVSSNEVVDLNSSDVRGVLVCCGVVGNGHLIRSISRDLRHAVGDVPRHFMVGIAVPDSQSSWKRLVQFLVQSGSRDYPYGISCWKVLPIGSDARQAWQSSLQLSSELDHIEVNPAWGMGKEVAEASIDDARSALSKCAGGFLESPLGKKQRLTNGFVYWVPPKKARIEDYDSEVVAFLSISSALQAAREADDQSIRLASTLHEVVVLDPEIFSRFNDGVLQSAILRAAKIGELNYTASPNHSELMREILEKVIANRALAAGEACLEFALALATGRLVLTPADSKLLRDYVIAEVQEQSPLLGLLCAYFKRI